MSLHEIGTVNSDVFFPHLKAQLKIPPACHDKTVSINRCSFLNDWFETIIDKQWLESLVN